MKKITSLFLSLVLLLNIALTCQISALAATVSGTCGKNVSWSLNLDTGKMTVSGKGEIENKSLEWPWESYKDRITAIDINDGITDIGCYAFQSCKSLKEVSLPNTLKTLSYNVFYYCKSLKEVSLPDSLVSMGHYCFAETGIESVTLPRNMDCSINESFSCFADCFKLKSINVAEGNPNLISIDGVLFYQQYYDSYLDTVLALMFYPHAKSGESYSVPDNVAYVAKYAFDGNRRLKKVDASSYKYTLSLGESAFKDCTNLSNFSVGDRVCLFGASAFENCVSLKTIDTEGLFGISEATFRNCESLKSITIRKFDEIPESAFSGCTSLTDVNYLGTEEEWKKVSVEEGNDELLSAKMHFGTLDSSPDNFRYVERDDGTLYVTDYVGNGTEIVIPSEINGKKVTGCAFYGIESNGDNYAGILSVTIPATVTDIDEKAFRFFTSLDEFIVDENNQDFKSVEGCLLSKDGTALISVPAAYYESYYLAIGEVKYVENYALFNCRYARYLWVDEGIKFGGTDIVGKNSGIIKIFGYSGTELQVNAVKCGIPYVTLDEYDYKKQSNGFDLKKDGYCFVNSGKAFSYPNKYKISYDVYRSVFGNSYTRQQYESVKEWGGNCFGMSATAALFEKKKLDFSTYSSGTVNSYYDSYDWLREILKLKSKSNLLRLIEQYQVWQDSQEANDVITSLNKEAQSFAGLFLKVIDIVNKTKEPLMIVVSWDKEDGKNVGHALVVDTSRAPTALGDNTWRLYLYDPNAPYSDSNKQLNPSVYSKYSNRYIDLNVVSGGWKMIVSTNSDGSPCEIGTPTANNKKEDTIAFFSTEDMTRNVGSGKATFLPPKDNKTTCMNISADDVSVKDESGNAFFTVQDGKIDYISDSAKFSVNCGYADDASTELTGKLYLPENKYVITFAESGTVQVLNSDYFVGVVAQPNTQLTVDNAGNVDCLGTSVTDADANIVIERNESERYTSVQTDVSVSKDKQVNLSLNKDDNYSVSGDDTVDTINVVSSKTNDIEYKISDYNKYESDFDDITDMASEKGEKTTPECKHSTTEVRNKKSPTCTVSGYTGDTVCTECETVLQLGTSVAPLGHSYKSYVTKATFSSDGTAYKKCTVCGAVANKSVLSRVSGVKLTKTSYVYDKKSKKPTLVVKDSKGNTLKKGNDYSVTYPKSCKNVGKYKVKVVLKGNYSGSKTLTYEIKPKGTSITKLTSGKGKFTAKIAKQKTQTTGYEIQYSTSRKFKGAKKVTLKNSATSKTVKKLKRNKKYYVRVRTYKKSGKTTCYSSWSKTKTIKIK